MTQDEILYHYTSIAGLNGIINSRNVWASDCRVLNDRRELVHAIELFLCRFKGDRHKILSLALHWYSFSQAHCVFSLSQSPKVLSQWRAYGDDGRGAAIGFARRFIAGNKALPTRRLVDCVYHNHESFIDSVTKTNEKDIEALAAMYVEAGGAVNSFWELIGHNPEPLARIYAELLRVKNPAFEEEQEVRLVLSIPTRKVQTRVTNGLIIPYVEHSVVGSTPFPRTVLKRRTVFCPEQQLYVAS